MENFNQYLVSLNITPEESKEYRFLFENLSKRKQKHINELANKVTNYDIEKLMFVIQPNWNKLHTDSESMTEKETLELLIGLREYKRRGLDMEYLTSGAGAPGNCIIS